MTSILTRQPLEHMATNRATTHDSGLSRRRSVRNFDVDEGESGAPPAKKQRLDDGTNGGGANIGAADARVTSKRTGPSAGKRGRKAYDEADDGFTFSRAKSKRSTTSKASAADAPSHTAARAEARKLGSPTAPAPEVIINRKRPRKTLPVTPEKDEDSRPPVRRSSRLSGESHAPAVGRIDDPFVVAHNGRKDSADERRRRVVKGDKHRSQARDPRAREGEEGGGEGEEVGRVGLPREREERYVEKNKPFQRIVLELGGDTPKYYRNKEFRRTGIGGGAGAGGVNDDLSKQQHRRSSAGLRGKRVSSLGMNVSSSSAQPHAEVATSDFYKHIGQDDLETKRTRQLLVWCASRALKGWTKKGFGGGATGKEADDVAEVQAQHSARIVGEEIVEALRERVELSNWYDRPADVAQNSNGRSIALVKKANPRNVQNAAKLVELEAELARLRAEKQSWDELVASVPSSAKRRVSAVPSSSTTTLQGSGKDDETTVAEDDDVEEVAGVSQQQKQQQQQKQWELLDATSIDAALLADPSQTALLSRLLDPKAELLRNEGSSTNDDNKDTGSNRQAQDMRMRGQGMETGMGMGIGMEKHPPSSSSSSSSSLAEALLQSRLDAASSHLHFKLDRLADSLHRLDRYVDTAARVAERVGRLSCRRLEERERERERVARAVAGGAGGADATGKVGDRELLRALGKAVNGDGSGKAC